MEREYKVTLDSGKEIVVFAWGIGPSEHRIEGNPQLSFEEYGELFAYLPEVHNEWKLEEEYDATSTTEPPKPERRLPNNEPPDPNLGPTEDYKSDSYLDVYQVGHSVRVYADDLAAFGFAPHDCFQIALKAVVNGVSQWELGPEMRRLTDIYCGQGFSNLEALQIAAAVVTRGY